MQNTIQEAAQHLGAAKSLVVLTGAGISKESGIPTFRDAMEGLWAQYDPQQLATPDAFRKDPKLVWDWYEHRREMMNGVKPNPGHYALAQLEDLLRQVVIVTQNIDGLHRLSGSSDVIELHGNIAYHKCFSNCQGDPTMVDINTLTWDKQAGPPKCPHCGANVRANVVWFNELLPLQAIDRAKTLCDNADVVLVVGTSGVVEPAASLPYRAKRHNDAFIIDVNPVPDTITEYADIFLAGPSGVVLPQIVEHIKNPI